MARPWLHEALPGLLGGHSVAAAISEAQGQQQLAIFRDTAIRAPLQRHASLDIAPGGWSAGRPHMVLKGAWLAFHASTTPPGGRTCSRIYAPMQYIRTG